MHVKYVNVPFGAIVYKNVQGFYLYCVRKTEGKYMKSQSRDKIL